MQAYLATQAQLQLMGEEPIPQKILRSRDSKLPTKSLSEHFIALVCIFIVARRTAERDLYDDSLFSPAKKRRVKGDD